jgi:hypothetical protein
MAELRKISDLLRKTGSTMIDLGIKFIQNSFNLFLLLFILGGLEIYVKNILI